MTSKSVPKTAIPKSYHLRFRNAVRRGDTTEVMATLTDAFGSRDAARIVLSYITISLEYQSDLHRMWRRIGFVAGFVVAIFVWSLVKLFAL